MWRAFPEHRIVFVRSQVLRIVASVEHVAPVVHPCVPLWPIDQNPEALAVMRKRFADLGEAVRFE